MNGTTAHQVFGARMEYELRAVPEAYVALLDAAKNLDRGFYGPIGPAIVQNTRRKHSILDAYVFLQLYYYFCRGRILHVKIELGEEPKSNNSIDDNNEILSTLAEPFEAKFAPVSGAPGGDGYLKWSSEINMASVVDFPGMRGLPRTNVHEISPSRAILEVGSTAAETTWMHLMDCCAVARWPYGSTDLIIMIHVDRWCGGLIDGKRPRPWDPLSGAPIGEHPGAWNNPAMPRLRRNAA